MRWHDRQANCGETNTSAPRWESPWALASAINFLISFGSYARSRGSPAAWVDAAAAGRAESGVGEGCCATARPECGVVLQNGTTNTIVRKVHGLRNLLGFASIFETKSEGEAGLGCRMLVINLPRH